LCCFILFQGTVEKPQQKQQQQAIDELQNTDVSAMQLHYKTVTGDKMTDISDDCNQQSGRTVHTTQIVVIYRTRPVQLHSG